MKKIMCAVLLISLSAGAAFAGCGKCPDGKKAAAAPAHEGKTARKDCGDCPMHKKTGARKCSGKMCPEKLAGVETVSRNIPEGIEVTMTAKDKETIAKMQELALVHYGNKETMDKSCPGRVEGAEVAVRNTPEGATVLITGKTPEIVSRIQQAAAGERMNAARPGKTGPKRETGASKKYVCPMNCATSDKPGVCPKCGMPMVEKK